MIEIARAKAAADNVMNVEFDVASIDDLDVPDQSFDAVLCLNILHLLADRNSAITRVHTMLKPGGVFVSSTACLSETMKFFKVIGPVGKFFGLIPIIKVFTPQDLMTRLTQTSFDIDHQWQPGKGKAIFVVAKKVKS
jgi:2-polyprenyl-3-methyl-5-hydroxy-6-metoxy-1,4-benzoquinol methylase